MYVSPQNKVPHCRCIADALLTCVVCLKLVCFYFVLTTFTTVGYGEDLASFCRSIASVEM